MGHFLRRIAHGNQLKLEDKMHIRHETLHRQDWGYAFISKPCAKACQNLVKLHQSDGLKRQNIKHENKINVLVVDFTPVRGKNQPIMGMQGRPSSGPAPMMDAMEKISRIGGTGLKPWLATLYIDHYLAEPVLVGCARRSARMSTKSWRDDDILELISIKRPIEYDGMTMEDVQDNFGDFKPLSFLWSSNNSVAVDKDFWDRVHGPITSDPLTIKAKMVYEYACQCAYGDGTGEPGFINVDRLTTNDAGLSADEFKWGLYIGSKNYQVETSTEFLLKTLYVAFLKHDYHYICNPCGGGCYDAS